MAKSNPVIKVKSFSEEILEANTEERPLTKWILEVVDEVNEIFTRHPKGWTVEFVVEKSSKDKFHDWLDERGRRFQDAAAIAIDKWEPELELVEWEGPPTQSYAKLGTLWLTLDDEKNIEMFADERDTKTTIRHELFHLLYFSKESFDSHGLLTITPANWRTRSQASSPDTSCWFTGEGAQTQFNKMYPTAPEFHNIGVPLDVGGHHLARYDQGHECLCVPGFTHPNRLMSPRAGHLSKLELLMARDLGFGVNLKHELVGDHDDEYKYPHAFTECHYHQRAVIDPVSVVWNPTEGCPGIHDVAPGTNYTDYAPFEWTGTWSTEVRGEKTFSDNHPWLSSGPLPTLTRLDETDYQEIDETLIDSRVEITAPQTVDADWVPADHCVSVDWPKDPWWRVDSKNARAVIHGTLKFAKNGGKLGTLGITLYYAFNYNRKGSKPILIVVHIPGPKLLAGTPPIACSPCNTSTDCFEIKDVVAIGTKMEKCGLPFSPITTPEINSSVKFTVCREDSVELCDCYIKATLFRKNDPTDGLLMPFSPLVETLTVPFKKEESCVATEVEFSTVTNAGPSLLGSKGLGVKLEVISSLDEV